MQFVGELLKITLGNWVVMEGSRWILIVSAQKQWDSRAELSNEENLPKHPVESLTP